MIKTGSRRSCFCLTAGLRLCAKISLCVKSTFPTAIAVFSSDKCTLFPFCCPIIGYLILEACRSPCDKQLAICFFFTETRATCSSFSLHMYTNGINGSVNQQEIISAFSNALGRDPDVTSCAICFMLHATGPLVKCLVGPYSVHVLQRKYLSVFKRKH